MFESAVIFSLSFAFGLLSYKLYFELKTTKPIRAQAKLKKPLYDFKGRLLSKYFY